MGLGDRLVHLDHQDHKVFKVLEESLETQALKDPLAPLDPEVCKDCLGKMESRETMVRLAHLVRLGHQDREGYPECQGFLESKGTEAFLDWTEARENKELLEKRA